MRRINSVGFELSPIYTGHFRKPSRASAEPLTIEGMNAFVLRLKQATKCCRPGTRQAFAAVVYGHRGPLTLAAISANSEHVTPLTKFLPTPRDAATVNSSPGWSPVARQEARALVSAASNSSTEEGEVRDWG